MEQREKLLELLMQRPLGYCTYSELADFLIENGVAVLDEETALAIRAGARAIGSNKNLLISTMVHKPFSKKPIHIEYTRAFDILNELSRVGLPERKEE